MTRRPALQSGDKVRIADGKFDPALIVRVKQVDGDLVEVQLGGGNSASFHRDQIRTVPDGSGAGDSARNTPESSTAVDTPVTTATLPGLGTLAMRMPLASLQVDLRYRVPLLGVKSSSDLVRPQSAQMRMPGGAYGFDARAGRGGRAALARAARHGLHRVCVHGVPLIGV